MGVARLYLGILLLAMAGAQTTDRAGFADAVETYDVLPAAGSAVLAAALLSGEAVAGAGLLSARHRLVGARLGVAVAVAWSVLALQAFARGLALDNCGCFGVHLAQELRWWVLVEDAAFVALAVSALRWARRAAGRPAHRSPGDRSATASA